MTRSDCATQLSATGFEVGVGSNYSRCSRLPGDRNCIPTSSSPSSASPGSPRGPHAGGDECERKTISLPIGSGLSPVLGLLDEGNVPGSPPDRKSRAKNGILRGWWGDPCGFKSRLRHHRNAQREFGRAPSSLFSYFGPMWLIWDSQGDCSGYLRVIVGCRSTPSSWERVYIAFNLSTHENRKRIQ